MIKAHSLKFKLQIQTSSTSKDSQAQSNRTGLTNSHWNVWEQLVKATAAVNLKDSIMTQKQNKQPTLQKNSSHIRVQTFAESLFWLC